MPIYFKANLACNFNCAYCYEHPFRPDEQNIDFDAVENGIRERYKKQYGDTKDEKGGSRIGLHGGEALTLSKDKIERFLKLSYDLSGRSSIQTNGYLIDDDIIEMFKKYKTGVGVSIDGPWPCNELRGIGSVEERKKQTEQILKNLDRLKKEGVSTSVIAVVHKKNALGDRREILKNWVMELNNKRISGRLNPCCCGKDDIDLTPEEAADFYSDMFDFMLRNGIGGWSPWKDMLNSLLQRPTVVCVFKDCDPYCTPSCIPIFEDGTEGVCLRLYTDGKIHLRGEQQTDLRSRVLQQTDCKDCPWWKNCYGGCVGLSKDFDWRNKDRYCLMYKTIFEKMVNVFKGIQLKRPPEQPAPTSSTPPLPGSPFQRGPHTDGIEHIDGGDRHLDSGLDTGEESPHSDHTDGIEHLDGDDRHLDGD